MTEPEYDKLVSQFGEQFTLACIEELDNYKGAKGRTYKSDYRAIPVSYTHLTLPTT